MIAFFNGRLVEEDQVGVPLFDHGLTVGDGVFETIDVRDGVCIAPTRHLARLARSAAGIGLDAPDAEEYASALDAVVAANPRSERAALRVTYTSGPGTIGSGRGGGTATRVVALRVMEAPDASADVAVVPWPRNERGALAGLKTTSYAENAVALADAISRGASEAIFANTVGHLCEGTGSNIFIVSEGRLVTPPLSSGCLAGITRALVLELSGLDIDERELPLEALYKADEAFLTSTTRDIQPIRAVDGRPLASCPGAFGVEVAEAFAKLITTTPDPV